MSTGLEKLMQHLYSHYISISLPHQEEKPAIFVISNPRESVKPEIQIFFLYSKEVKTFQMYSLFLLLLLF